MGYHPIETSHFQSVGIIGSIIGAVVVLLIPAHRHGAWPRQALTVGVRPAAGWLGYQDSNLD